MLKTTNKLKAGGQIVLVPHEIIFPNPKQPRQHFDYDELEGLAESIRANGILQPINVRPMPNGSYELISGERRLRAARIVGLTRVPCIILEADDEHTALYSLLENLQRQDLAFFEEAVAIDRLYSDFSMTQEEIAKKLGKSQSALSNKLRLLKLPEDMRIRISRADLTERHARALLRLDSTELRERALGIIIDKRLNVNETDRLIGQMLKRSIQSRRPPVKIFKDIRIFINTLNNAVDTMRRAGIEADSAKSETAEYIEYIVRIPKTETKAGSSAG